MDLAQTESLTELLSQGGGFVGKMGLAALLGGLIGLDRERSGKPAGLRTNLLICVGAALLTDLSLRVAQASDSSNGGSIQADPARIAAQIVSGIGFLGAGTILQSRGSVTGLTTAATLWVVAAIGMAIGASQYMIALVATGIVMVALMLLPKLERWTAPNPPVRHSIDVVMVDEPDAVGRIEQLLDGCGLRVDSRDAQRRENELHVRYYTHGKEHGVDAAVRALLGHASVKRVFAK